MRARTWVRTGMGARAGVESMAVGRVDQGVAAVVAADASAWKVDAAWNMVAAREVEVDAVGWFSAGVAWIESAHATAAGSSHVAVAGAAHANAAGSICSTATAESATGAAAHVTATATRAASTSAATTAISTTTSSFSKGQ